MILVITNMIITKVVVGCCYYYRRVPAIVIVTNPWVSSESATVLGPGSTPESESLIGIRGSGVVLKARLRQGQHGGFGSLEGVGLGWLGFGGFG